jgi:hypothetical protein
MGNKQIIIALKHFRFLLPQGVQLQGTVVHRTYAIIGAIGSPQIDETGLGRRNRPVSLLRTPAYWQARVKAAQMRAKWKRSRWFPESQALESQKTHRFLHRSHA